MHWLSHGVEQLIQSCQSDTQPFAPDVLVVGSGYGGAVAALRFAEHGLQVAVLERGAEYQAGEFPNDLSQVGGFVRAEVSGAVGKAGATVVGYEDALFDFRVGTRATALVGNGLGGGSLINAAVALRPDPRVFAQDAWPALFRQTLLADDFAMAEKFLEVQASTTQKVAPACVPQSTLKYQRMHDIGRAAQARFGSARLSVTTEDVPLAIEFRKNAPTDLGPRAACVGCGDCCSGCNHNAKLSLDKTYLARAHKAGAAMYTGVSVLFVRHQPDVAFVGKDWVVHCVRTTERGAWAQASAAQCATSYEFTVRAGQVVLSAGTFGTSEILLRSQALGLPVASAWLGKGISANGDDLCAAFDLDGEANAVGEGSGPPPVAPQKPVGPTISAVIRFHDHLDHTRSTVTQDGGIPGMLGSLALEALTTLGILPQLTRFGMRGSRSKSGKLDPLAVRPDAIRHSLALLGMGHDTSAGGAELVDHAARLSWSWAEQAKDPAPMLHRARGTSVEGAGAEFVPNPGSGVLPDRVSNVLSGPKAPSTWITVHPLGGCRMGASPHKGVVNHRCEVFRPDGSVHAGLLVMDGSVIPTSLGVNPLLTITALAERACRLQLEGRGAGAHGATPVPSHALPTQPIAKQPMQAVEGAARGAVLAEVLRGSLTPKPKAKLPQWLAPLPDGQPKKAALFLEMDITDWNRLWADPTHTVQAITHLSGPAGQGRRGSFTASRLVVDQPNGPALELAITRGTVSLFAPVQEWLLPRLGRAVRCFCTYWIARWHPDGMHPNAPKGSLQTRWDGAKLLWHASAARSFSYQLELSDGVQQYQIKGSKLIQPALSWSELWSWVKIYMRQGGWPAPQRRSVWDQLTQLQVSVSPAGSSTVLAEGLLSMDIPEMARRIAPQMKPGPDVVNALAAFISYPMILLRYIVSSRLLDFRLPDYQPDLPATDPAVAPDDGQFELAHDAYPVLQVPGGGMVVPQAPVCLTVPLKGGTTPALGSADWIRVGLVRYAQPHVDSVTGQDGSRRFKSIILLNGFAQNTLPFVAEELGPRALAAMLYAQGWDVWLLEYRVSPFLRASARLSTMDDIGACDIPAAVQHVLQQLEQERSDPALPPGQLFVFSHCVGSASMAMSLLGGHLQHADGRAQVAGVLFSQFQPYVIGSVTAQMRLQVASLLVNAMGLEFVEFAGGTVQADGLHALMDRLFASFHYDAAERCPAEHDLRNPQPDCTSCKRMSGFLSRLFRHDQLIPSTPGRPGTHEKLDSYFGRTNLGVFLHGAKCAEYEHLVDADGQNIYVTDDNVRRFLTMPVMLLHGEDNVLFDKESLEETQRQFSRAFGAERLLRKHDRFLLAPGHAHFDCTIGKRAPEVIFGPVVDFFNNALVAEMPEPCAHNRLRGRLPRTGPIAGWCRHDGNEQVFRVWIEVDNSQADQAVAAMTLIKAGSHRRVQTWALSSNPLEGLVGVAAGAVGAAPDQSIVYAVADLEVPDDWRGKVTILMVSLHRFTGDAPVLAPYGALADELPSAALTATWGVPMTVGEAQASCGRSPALTAHGGNADVEFESVPDAMITQFGAKDASAGADGGHEDPQRAVARVLPQALSLDVADALAILRPLACLVHAQRAVARAADPGTLSRQRRTLRSMGECVLRLNALASLPVAGADTPLPLRFFAATCRHPGITPLESHRNDHSLNALAQRQRAAPAAHMWMLGDQIYADARGGLVTGASPVENLLPQYRGSFGSAGFRALARQLPLYMVMDDHEIADNWSRDDVQLGRTQEVLFKNGLSAFNAFQRSSGPPGRGSDGVDYAVDGAGAAFLALNTRLHRDRALGQGGQRQILNSDQWQHLQLWLLDQQARGKHPKFLVSGSVLAPGVVQGQGMPSPRDSDNWQLVAAERQRLLSFIADQRIDNVVFLSGDYHCSARGTIAFSNSPVKAWCLVAPPLHAPMRFANVAAEDVLTSEVVPLTCGSAHIEAQAWNGEGWLECEVQQTAAGAALHTRFNLQTFDAAAPHTVEGRWDLV